MSRRVSLSLALLLLPACGPTESGPTERTPAPFYDANAEAGIDADAVISGQADASADAEAARLEGRGAGLNFARIELSPQDVRLNDTIEADAPLRPGASPFAEVEYQWSINGVVLRNVTKGELSPSKGKFRKGDTIQVTATAIDELGHTATITSDEIEILNSTPRILTDASRRYGIDGLRLEAEDDDGDELEWSVVAGPPGVEIDRTGLISVRQTDIQEAFDGELIIAATDPDGARAEYHVPVQVNAAREEVQVEVTTTTERNLHNMTDEEYEKANIDAAERVEGMSEAELKEYWDDQARREDARNKQD